MRRLKVKGNRDGWDGVDEVGLQGKGINVYKEFLNTTMIFKHFTVFQLENYGTSTRLVVNYSLDKDRDYLCQNRIVKH